MLTHGRVSTSISGIPLRRVNSTRGLGRDRPPAVLMRGANRASPGRGRGMLSLPCPARNIRPRGDHLRPLPHPPPFLAIGTLCRPLCPAQLPNRKEAAQQSVGAHPFIPEPLESLLRARSRKSEGPVRRLLLTHKATFWIVVFPLGTLFTFFFFPPLQIILYLPLSGT